MQQKLVQSEKGTTCKSLVAANDSLCVDREGNRLESKGTVELAAPWEEGRLDDVELAREIDENTVDVERPLAWLRTVVDEEKSGVRFDGAEAYKERRTCITIRCETEYGAFEVFFFVWCTSRRERAQGTGFRVASVERARGRCKNQRKDGTAKST